MSLQERSPYEPPAEAIHARGEREEARGRGDDEPERRAVGAMICPALLAAIGDDAHPSWRASSVGVYRLWRDLKDRLALRGDLEGPVVTVLPDSWHRDRAKPWMQGWEP